MKTIESTCKELKKIEEIDRNSKQKSQDFTFERKIEKFYSNFQNPKRLKNPFAVLKKLQIPTRVKLFWAFRSLLAALLAASIWRKFAIL